MTDIFVNVATLTKWLDDSNPPGLHEDSMRVLKLVEEAGEAAAAYIGMVGQNPRKGVTHNLVNLLEELADVAITAMCAMQHFTHDIDGTRQLIEEKLENAVERAGLK